MVVRRDIVAISIPFSAGVTLAAVCSPGGEALYLAAAASCIAIFLSMAASCGRGERLGAEAVLLFSAGFFCHCSSAASLDVWSDSPQWAETALERMTVFIDEVGYAHDSTGALLKALITGQRDNLPQETVEAFRVAGAAHILALSGLHLGIIYGILSKSLFWLGHGRTATLARSIATVVFCLFYVIATGAAPSVVRAFLFIVFNELSRQLPGRRRRPLAILCAALTVQLAFSPQVIESVGFQLSYLSMMGIIVLFPRLEKWYPASAGWDIVRRVWKAMALTVSCQIFTAPAVWLYFRTFPRFFLLTNLICIPLTELLMTCAVCSILLNSLGTCPEAAKSLVDWLGQTLVQSLDTIASIS